jgi:hypothetical protein
MPSPRSRLETACRIGAFGLLGWLLGTSIVPSATRRVERVTPTNVEDRMAEITRGSSSSVVHFDASQIPDAWVTDWLAALQRGGRQVTWSGNAAEVMLAAQPEIDPAGGVHVDVSAPAGSTVMLRDDAGVIDSVRVPRLGASAIAPVVVGTLRAELGGTVARTIAADSSVLRPVIVIGGAGWEAKYVVSALEERGWPVTSRFSVAPNVDVTAGAGLELDTARVAAVIAIDSTVATLGSSLERFVRSGGGLVLAGNAGVASNVRAIAPGSLAARTRPAFGPADTLTLGSTGYYPLTNVRDDGVVLERRSGGVAMAARRVGAGRVLELGYDDSWRWRMAGASGSEAAHRAWWTRVVGSAAYVPGSRESSFSFADAAPRAYLVDRLGPPRAVPSGAEARPVDRRIIITVIMILLIAEWSSRRLRGLR